MGLDQYLYANRSFAPNDETVDSLLAPLSLTVEQLSEMADQDPREHETTFYLSLWDFSSDDEREKATAVLSAAGLLAMRTDGSQHGYIGWHDNAVGVSIVSIYWRKANAIHGWFVENCQGGIDECQEVEVHAEQLAQLRDLCADALAAYEAGDPTKAAEIMTPVDGFFFGGTEIDEWYAEDLRHTISEIERVVQQAIEIGGVTFTYRSSW